MSFWKRLFKRDGEPDVDDGPTDHGEAEARARGAAQVARRDAAARKADAAEERRRERLERLRRVGRPRGADLREAVAALRASSGQAEQTVVLDALLEGLAHVTTGLDPARVACASLLEEQGQRGRALRLLEPCRSVPGMMLAAELHAAEGHLARAVSMVERVLARAIDTPGAKERHARWCAQLGRAAAGPDVDVAATVVAPALDRPGTSFRLVREVARGGAGTVYLAEDGILGRQVAFKVYHRPTDDAEQLEREARTAVRLAGAGVARVFDVDPAAGWIASEWIERGSLRQWLNRGQIEALFPLGTWFAKLVHAVTRVHDEGLVHGDLKPANVLFREPEDPVLTDFGLCAPPGRREVLGTPGYLSPERLAGAPSEPADDVYALGRILEDVVGAREDAQGGGDDPEVARWATIAVACLSPAAERPRDAHAVIALLEAHEGDGPPAAQ